MNSKKLTALLCAAAIASSTLVPVMASADETANLSENKVLWSDTFDAYTNDSYGVGGTAALPLLVCAIASRDSYAIEGAKLVTTGKEDDSSYFLTEAVTEEDATDLAVTTTISRFATTGRGAYIQFDETYTPSEDQDLVLSTKVKINADETNVYAPAFKIGNVLISNEVLGVENNTWADLKIAYYKDGTSEVIVNDTPMSAGSETSLSSIDLSALNADGTSYTADATKAAAHPYGYHTVSFDDMVVYLTDDAYAEAPAAETHGVVITPEPTATPEPKAAPAITVPADAVVVIDENLDDETVVKYTQGTEGVDQTAGGVRYTIGGRASGGDSSTYVSIEENVAGDNIMAIQNGKFGNSGRSVKVYLTNDVKAADLSAEGFVSFGFAARLTPTETYPSIINIRKADTGDTLTTLTTDETATSGIVVPADEWFTVEYLMYADGSLFVLINGTEYPLSTTATALPYLDTQDGSANAVYTGADFDNFVVYVADPDYIPTTPTPEPTVPPVVAFDDEAVVDYTQDMGALDANYSHYFGTEGTTYTDIDGLSYYIGGRADGANGDVTNVRVVTDSYENQYLMAQTDKYGANGRAPRFEFVNAPKLEQLATDDDYVAVSFAAKLIPHGDTPATLVFPMTDQFSTDGNYYVFNAGTLTTEEGQATTVPANTWVVIDVVVYKTGEYEIYVDAVPVITGDTVGSAGGGSDKMTLTGLPYVTTNDCEEATYVSYAIDNVVVFHTGELTAVTTPVPTAEPVAAPAVNAENNTTVIFADNFNGLEASSTRMSATEALTVEVGSNLTATMGYREGESSSEAQYTSVNVKKNVEADNVLNLTGGKFGTATRAPRVAVVNSPDASAMAEDEYIAMGFAFKLNSVANVTDQISALTLIANADDTVVLDENGENTNTQTKDDGNVYGYVYGAFTTNEADAVEGSVEYVKADVWHTAEVIIYSDGEWFVSLDGVDVFTGNGLAYSNGDKVPTTKLPQLVAGKNAKSVVTYPSVDIDNMVVYTSEVPTLADVAITAATAEAAVITADVETTAKVIVATYDADGRLVSASTQIANLVAGENTVAIAAAAGDVVMAWTAYNNQGVQPYCAPVVVQ